MKEMKQNRQNGGDHQSGPFIRRMNQPRYAQKEDRSFISPRIEPINGAPPMIQRQAQNPQVSSTDNINVTIGQEISFRFFQAAVINLIGKTSMDDFVLRNLIKHAIAENGTVTEYDRMFIANLYWEGFFNQVKSYEDHLDRIYSSDVLLQIPAGAIGKSTLDRIANFNRPAPLTLEGQIAWPNSFLSWGFRSGAGTVLDTFAPFQTGYLSWGYQPDIGNILQDLSKKANIPLFQISNIIDNATSDPLDPEDSYAASLTVAMLLELDIKHPLLSRLGNGELKIDSVPRAYIRTIDEEAGAFYQSNASGDGVKENTIYFPDDIDYFDAFDRSSIIHELKHAEDDFSGVLETVEPVMAEWRAYLTQAKYMLQQITNAGTDEQKDLFAGDVANFGVFNTVPEILAYAVREHTAFLPAFERIWNIADAASPLREYNTLQWLSLSDPQALIHLERQGIFVLRRIL